MLPDTRLLKPGRVSVTEHVVYEGGNDPSDKQRMS